MTNPDSQPPAASSADEEAIRPHVFDGIQEYDKRLPRWWLLTLYGAMVFSVGYWGYYHTYRMGLSPEQELVKEMAENTARASQQEKVVDDTMLYQLSLNAETVAAGRATFDTTCAACHKADLTGLIGPNLVDQQWIHGGLPMDAVRTITDGVPAKGMPAWGAMLGKQKTVEVVAYIFSFHKPGEPVVAVPSGAAPGAGGAGGATP